MNAHPSSKQYPPLRAHDLGVMNALAARPEEPPIPRMRWPRYLRLPGWGRFARTWVIGMAQAVAACYLVFVHWANPAPKPAELMTAHVKVISTQRLSPHLTVEMPDGSRRHVEFATAIGAQGTEFLGLGREVQKALPGCTGHIHFVPLQMLPGNRLRVWAMECGTTRLSFTSAVEYFARDVEIAQFCLFVYAAMATFFTAFLYWLDRKESKGDRK